MENINFCVLRCLEIFFFCFFLSLNKIGSMATKVTEKNTSTPFLPEITKKVSNDLKKVSEAISEAIPTVRWAPLRGIPFERRVQTASVLCWVFLLGNCLTLFCFSLCLPFLWPLHIAYITYIWLDKSPENGGRRSDWFRRLPCWSYFAAYFPVKLVKVHILSKNL